MYSDQEAADQEMYRQQLERDVVGYAEKLIMILKDDAIEMRMSWDTTMALAKLELAVEELQKEREIK